MASCAKRQTVSKEIFLCYVSNNIYRFLYALVVCVDANFRLKNLLVLSYSRDPNLGIGWAYMVERKQYERWIRTRTNDEDVRVFNWMF